MDYPHPPRHAVGDPKPLIRVQSVVIGPADRLWILDTGRAALPNSTLPTSTFGGPKLVGINLSNLSNLSIFTSIPFPQTRRLPQLLPRRRVFRPLVLPDPLGRRRSLHHRLLLGRPERDRHRRPRQRLLLVPSQQRAIGAPGTRLLRPGLGNSYLPQPGPGPAHHTHHLRLGWNHPVRRRRDILLLRRQSRYLSSVPTQLLRSQSPTSELLAAGAAQQPTQKGVSDGRESNTNDIVYARSLKTNSAVTFNPANGMLPPLVRDPRTDRTDTMSVSADGYLYFTESPLFLAPSQQGGVDKRVKPYKRYRVPLPKGSKVFYVEVGAEAGLEMCTLLKFSMGDMGGGRPSLCCGCRSLLALRKKCHAEPMHAPKLPEGIPPLLSRSVSCGLRSYKSSLRICLATETHAQTHGDRCGVVYRPPSTLYFS